MKYLKTLSVKQLLANVKADDGDAFGEIYRLYRKKVYTFAYRFVRCSEDAHELTQDVFVRLWESRGKIDPEKNFDAYLFSMVRSYFLDALKKKTRMSVYRAENPDEPTDDSTDQYIELRECRKIVMQAIESLSPQARTAYLLSRERGYSHAAISQQMGIAPNTVSNHIKKSLGHIRARFRYLSPDTILPVLLLMISLAPELG